MECRYKQPRISLIVVIPPIKTTAVYNYSFVGNVLFMQGIQSTIEYDDPSKDTVTADTSITTLCAAYVQEISLQMRYHGLQK